MGILRSDICKSLRFQSVKILKVLHKMNVRKEDYVHEVENN